MLRINPFQALRPRPELVAEVSCVPYDVVDRAAAAALAAQNPLSFLHVSRPEIGLPETTPLDAAVVYARAADNFKALQDKGVFVREAEPSLYLYRLQQAAHKQCGLVACCHAED